MCVSACARVPGGGMEHDEEINICSDERKEEEKKHKTLISYQKHWFQFSGALLQTMSGCNYPTLPQNGPLLWLAASNHRGFGKALNMFKRFLFFQFQNGALKTLPAQISDFCQLVLVYL